MAAVVGVDTRHTAAAAGDRPLVGRADRPPVVDKPRLGVDKLRPGADKPRPGADKRLAGAHTPGGDNLQGTVGQRHALSLNVHSCHNITIM